MDSESDLPSGARALSIADHGRAFQALRAEIGRRIVGQDAVVAELLTAILAEGHCLITGVPGLAKSLLVSSLAELMSLRSKRIQFTPDLMPSDITGATIIAQEGGKGERGYQFLPGPIFTNLLLADEINRTPPKTQASLIEAMEERQVTAGGRRFPLERPFFVLATQNPIDQEGTYSLPVTQTDRFLFSIVIDYPEADEEFEILQRTTSGFETRLDPILDREAVRGAIALVRSRVAIPEPLIELATRVTRLTRPAEPDAPPFIKEWLSWGAGPRAVQSLILGAKAHALLHGREEAVIEDLRRIARPTLRHRLLLNYHAQAEGVIPDQAVGKLLVHLGIEKEAAAPGPTPRKGFLARWLGR